MTAATPLSVSPLTMFDAAAPDQVSAAAEAGFGAVGLRVWSDPDEPSQPLLADTPLRRETKRRLEATGLAVLDVELIRLRPGAPPDEALRILDAGAYFGASFVLVVGADPDEGRLVDRYAAVCEAAAERGLRACLEFMAFTEVRSVAAAVRVVEAAGHPAGAVLVDPLHLRRCGGSPDDVAALAPERLPYAQLCDAPLEPADPAQPMAEARTGRLLPGDGELPLRELLAVLPAETALSVETPVAALAGRPAAERARLAFAAATALLAGVR